MKRASTLESAVAAFCGELGRFARDAAADVDAVTAALAAEPGTRAASAGVAVRAGPARDAAAPFLDMLTRATEDAEDAVEAVGALAGVTVPRAQELVAAALGAHAQQAAALRELEGLLRELGVPLPHRRTLPQTQVQPEVQEQVQPQPQPQQPQAEVAAPLEAYGISDATRRMLAAGRKSSSHGHRDQNSRSSAQFSVDVRTGRVSVSHRRVGTATATDESADVEEPTLLSVPAALAAAAAAETRKGQQEQEQQKQEKEKEEEVPEATPLCAAEVPDARGAKESERRGTDVGPVAPFASMAELTASVPSFLLSTTLEDLNASIAALNRTYAAQQQRGGPRRLTSDEAYAVLGDDRLRFFFPPTHTYIICVLTHSHLLPTALRCRAKLLVLQKAGRIRMTVAGTTTVWVPQDSPGT